MLKKVYTLLDRMSEQHNVYKVMDRQLNGMMEDIQIHGLTEDG